VSASDPVFKGIPQRLLLGAALVGMLWVYFWFAYHGTGVTLEHDDGSYYGRLTNSLLSGKLYLEDKPPPELLALQDPYDPKQNSNYQSLPDVSLFEGKYYLYFGITPVLLMGIPLSAFGLSMREDFAGAVFCWIALLAGLATLRNIARKCELHPPVWMWLAAIAVSGFTLIPFLLCRCAVYEAAIASGYCCTMLALYYLSSACLAETLSKRKLFLASIFFALAVGARPNLILHGWILVLAALWAWRNAGATLREKVQTQVSLWLPYFTIGFFLGLYNFLRFHSWTEFGFHYQLSIVNTRTLRTFGLDYLREGIYFYLFSAVTFDANFPFIHAYWPAFDRPYRQEPTVGIVEGVPFILIVGLSFILLRRKQFVLRDCPPLLGSVLILLAAGLVQMAAVSVAVPSVSMRYMMDFVPLFVMAAILIWFAIQNHLRVKAPTMAPRLEGLFELRRSIHGCVLCAIAFGCVVNLAVGMTGYYNDFRYGNPELYYGLRRRCKFVRQWVKSCAGPRRDVSAYEFSIQLPAQPPPGDVSEPILTRGALGAADHFFVKYIGADKFELGWLHWGEAKPVMSWRFAMPPDRRLDMLIDVDQDVTVFFNNRYALTCTQPLYPATSEQTFAGKNPFEGKVEREFSGTVVNFVVHP
jgi:hypothetical protein